MGPAPKPSERSPLDPLPRNALLERQVRDEAAGALVVYADFLIGKGDPRGEALARALAGGQDTGWAARHVHRLVPGVESGVEVHGQWLGPLLKHLTVRCDGGRFDLIRLLEHPVALTLRGLHLKDELRSGRAWIEALRRADHGLHTLRLAGLQGRMELGGRWEAFRGVKELRLTGHLDLDGLSLPETEVLELYAGQIWLPDQVELPRLAHLGVLTPDAARLLDRVPAGLRSLEVVFGEAAQLALLTRSAVAGSLRGLQVHGGPWLARALSEQRGVLSAVEELVFFGDPGDAEIIRLERAYPAVRVVRP